MGRSSVACTAADFVCLTCSLVIPRPNSVVAAGGGEIFHRGTVLML